MTMPPCDQNRIADIGGVWRFHVVRTASAFEQAFCGMWNGEMSEGWFGGRCQDAKCPMCLFRTIGAGRVWSRLPAHGFALIGWRDCTVMEGVAKARRRAGALSWRGLRIRCAFCAALEKLDVGAGSRRPKVCGVC